MRLASLFSSFVGTGPALAVGFGVCFVLGNFAFTTFRPARTSQPIAFNHAKHIANGVGCTDCHAGADQQARAGLPTVETCRSCHESALTESPEEAKLRRVVAAGEELRWAKLVRVPNHVYFSHRRHVQSAKLDCAGCHGAMDKVTAPPQRVAWVPTMKACLACHQSRGVKSDCNDCHR